MSSPHALSLLTMLALAVAALGLLHLIHELSPMLQFVKVVSTLVKSFKERLIGSNKALFSRSFNNLWRNIVPKLIKQNLTEEPLLLGALVS